MKRLTHQRRNRRRSASVRRGLPIAGALVAAASQAYATDRFWAAPFGGAFNSTANWSTTDGGAGGASVPGVNDVAHWGRTTDPTIFQATYTVTFSTSPTNQALRIEDDFVTFGL